MTDIIVIMATQTTDMVTSRGPCVHRYLPLNQHGRANLDRISLHFQVVMWFQPDS
jgi:hypothetical protein